MDAAAAKSAEAPPDPPLGSKPPPKKNNIPVAGGVARDKNIHHDSQNLQQPPKIGSRSAKLFCEVSTPDMHNAKNLDQVVNQGIQLRDNILSSKDNKDVEKEMQDKNQTKNDDLLDQFDQFVVHAEMEKRKKVALELQSPQVLKDTCNQIVPFEDGKMLGPNIDQSIVLEGDNFLHEVVPLATKDPEKEQNAETENFAINDTTIMEAPEAVLKFLSRDEEDKNIEEDESDDDDASKQLAKILPDGESDEDISEFEDSSNTFIPTGEELSEERPPEIGMLFDTLEASQRFLNIYGYLHGYGVVKGRNYKNKKITFQCCLARKTHAPNLTQRKRKRFCLWHIMNNCSDKMGGFMAAREGMEDEMRNIIMDSLTIEEFESKWNAMIEKYDAASRSEGMNSIFKDYVKRKDTLETFLVQYELFQETIIEAENDDRFVSIGLEPIYWGHNLVEKHAGKIYTRGIFFKFQDEMHNSTAFGVEVIEENKIYNLKKNFNYKGQEFHQQSFRVEVDRTKELFDCICGKFERDGILCCHVLRLFTQFDINQIPDHYINKRWTKEYRETELLKHKKRMIDEGAGSESSQVSMRYAIVMNKVSDLCAEVCKDANSSKEFLEEIQKLQEKYTLKHKTQPAQGAPPHEEPLKDPPIRSNKSVDKGDRLKRQSEKKTNKKKAKKKNADDKSDLP
nr:uncharacterized protein LOC127304424 [Lolium perenne]